MKNPIALLLAILLASFLVSFLISLQLNSASSEMLVRNIRCISFGGWLISAALCVWLARVLLKNYLNPVLEARAKLVSQLDNISIDAGIDELSSKIIDELDSARQRERLIVDYSSELLFSLDETSRFIEVNPRAESLLGYSIASLLGAQIESVVYSEDLALLEHYLQSSKSGESDKLVELRFKKADGNLIDFELQSEWSKSLNCYFGLCRDISERKQNQRLKAEVAAMITHDLRTPIAGLSYFLESLGKGTYGDLPPQAKAQMANARISVENVLTMINQLLEAEKLESGSMVAEQEYIPLSDLYEHCNSLVSSLAKKKNLSISFPESSAIVFADFGHLVQVLSNLLSNAIKFSPADSQIYVLESETDGMVNVSVIDSGPGVSDSMKEKVFERFRSEKLDAGEQLFAASGLGLYISRKLVELQGGELIVKDATAGGACFLFSLKKVRSEELDKTS